MAEPLHTEQEQLVLEHLVAAWDAFVELTAQHPDEQDDFRRGIHFLQYMMATRAVRRLDPTNWPIYNKGAEGDSSQYEDAQPSAEAPTIPPRNTIDPP